MTEKKTITLLRDTCGPGSLVRELIPGLSLSNVSPVDALLDGQEHIVELQLKRPEIVRKYYQPENEDVADMLARRGNGHLIKLVSETSRRMTIPILDFLAFYGQLALIIYFHERHGVDCTIRGANWAVNKGNHAVIEYLSTILPTAPTEGEGTMAILENPWYMHHRDRRMYRWLLQRQSTPP